MKKTWFNFFMCLFVLLFAGLWISGSVAEARSKGMKKRGHHRHHYPYRVDVPKIVAVAGGGSHTIELKSDGTVWAWGDNQYGQLGDGTTIDSPAPIQVSGLTDVTAIAAGGRHTIALKTDGTVWAWGDNQYGQLGATTSETCVSAPYYNYPCSTTPIQVSGLTDVIAIAAGGNYYFDSSGHSIALKSDGTVWAWGENRYGQLGTETIETCQDWYLSMSAFFPGDGPCSTTPVQVSKLTDVTTIAAGDDHTIALKNDGTVWAWGSSRFGQLGDGTMYGVTTTPVQVSGLTNVAIITAGMKHSIALKADGTVWAWGRNYSGQLGDGTNASSAVPVQVSGLTDVTAITAGGDDLSWWGKSSHTIALKSDGTVWAWGSNEHGQLGVTTTEICEIGVSFGEHGGYTYPTFCSTIPVQVSELTDITAIAAGGLHTIALKSDSTVWAWGDNEYEQLGATTTETCGYENNFDCSPTPVPVKSKATGAFSVGGTISGLTGTLVLQNNGGDDLTIAENGSFTFATELEDLAIYDITVFTQPLDQTCSVSSGRINAADVIDIEIKCFTFVAIAAGGYHTLALETDGTVWAWGSGSRGQLGDGTMIYSTTTPIQVSGLTDVAAISAGSTHTIALKNDGTVWAWGDNTLGQLGVITTESCGYSDNNYLACSTTPVQVSGLTDVAAISAGSAHTIALKNDGTVWAWGRNDFGQLGVETIETCGYVVSYACSTTPVEVSGLTDVTAIVAGGAHTITLRNDGTVWAWGDNNAGQLGDGTTHASTTPVQVSDLTDVVTIAAGSGHTLAIKTDGTVLAWGSNSVGQLGAETTETCIYTASGSSYSCSSTPVQVSGLTDVTAIASKSGHNIVVKTDGTAWAWGWNRFGQLGDGTTIDSSAPIQVSGLTDVATVATGNVHTIALKNDSTIWAWGSNSSGELGAVTMDSSTPVQVLITP